MLDVIICANFCVKKLRDLENTMGQILEFLIEMAGHPYNTVLRYCAACDPKGVIANFVPNFVVMATGVSRGKIRLAAFDR